MSLPACQERALSSIEGALTASEPHLASMFAIFTRLNQDEPVGAEPLARGRLPWLRPRRALSAIVLIPVMFATVIVGALLSGGARGAAPILCATAPVSRLVAMNGIEQALSSRARTATRTSGLPGMC
jgi:hypothetical protein